MTVPHSSALGALHQGQILAAQVEASDPSLLAWVGVYPLDLARESTHRFLHLHGQALPPRGQRVYHVRKLEAERRLIEQDVSIAEPELQNKTSFFAHGDEELASVLTGIGLQIDQLALPFKSGYPI